MSPRERGSLDRVVSFTTNGSSIETAPRFGYVLSAIATSARTRFSDRERGFFLLGARLVLCSGEVSMPQLKQQSVTPISEMTVILGALNALKRGDTAVRLPLDWTGVSGRVADVFN